MIEMTIENESCLSNCLEMNIENHIDELFSYPEDDDGDKNDNEKKKKKKEENSNDDYDDDKQSLLYHTPILETIIKNPIDTFNNIQEINFMINKKFYYSHDNYSNDIFKKFKNEKQENEVCLNDENDHIEECFENNSLSGRSVCSLLVPFEFRAILADSPYRGIAMISNFGSMKTLYHRISQEFDICSDDILYCTLNTPMPDMNRVLGGQIGLDDIIFVHQSSKHRKEVEMRKSDLNLGLTIADNGNGRAFIKHIRAESIASRVPFIQPGDHIEAIQGKSYVGTQHCDVAEALRTIERDTVFIITLIEPKRGQFCIENQLYEFKQKQITIKKNNGDDDDADNHEHKVHEAHETAKVKALHRINAQLEHFIGVKDSLLAQELYNAAYDRSPKEFAASIANGSLSDFCFPAHVLAIIWNSVNFPP